MKRKVEFLISILVLQFICCSCKKVTVVGEYSTVRSNKSEKFDLLKINVDSTYNYFLETENCTLDISFGEWKYNNGIVILNNFRYNYNNDHCNCNSLNSCENSYNMELDLKNTINGLFLKERTEILVGAIFKRK